MTETSACPDELELCDLARGTLSSARLAPLRDHIGDCEACRVTVAELTSSLAAHGTETADEEAPRYELTRLLATGGMGEVFLARDRVLGREVAIKLLHEDATSADAVALSRKRILREAQALASFAHPNVVAAYDLGVLDGRAFLAMEYVAGRTLRAWIADEEPDLDRVIDVVVQAGRGLVAAHDKGLVHRDFKPDNLLVGDDGRARVTDFGLACSVPTGEPRSGASLDARPPLSITTGSTIAGTPAYMAPEQFAGVPPDARSDQYAFAVTLYEAIHGARPVRGAAATAPAKNADSLQRVDAALRRALESDPKDRYPSMRELIAALEARTAVRRRRLSRAVVMGGAVALLALVFGARSLLQRHVAAASPAVAAAGLHSACGGPSGACAAPFVCRYPDGNFCGASGAPGVCAWPEDGCDAKATEVCGCDGTTYKNNCESHRQGVSSAHRGACVSCTSSAACPDVNTRGVRAPAFCRIDGASSLAGVCWPRPSGCEAGGVLVCGRDGRTYESSCEARRAGFDVEHEGPCVPDAREHEPAQAAGAGNVGAEGLAFGAPDEQGIDAEPLIRLAEWIESEKLPIYSLLVSKDGVVVYELYTSSVTRDQAHYLMGATSALTSALMGVAIDRHLVRSPETTVADALPASLFPSHEVLEQFRRVTIRDVLAMSALATPIPPQDKSEEARERGRKFWASPDKLSFALAQPLVPAPGTTLTVSDITPEIATGIIQHASHTSALELAEDALFGPMGFRNYEWMYRDEAGTDAGAYGLRLRPVDMQKLGVLYLREGLWGGRRLLSTDWVRRSFSPWMKRSGAAEPNYGWYWWAIDYSSQGEHDRWLAHVASGWKGQRIAVFSGPGVVVTMTAVLEAPEDESAIFRRIVRDYVMPAVDGTGAAPAHPDEKLRRPLSDLLSRVRTDPVSWKPLPEDRLVPSIEPKERRNLRSSEHRKAP